MPKEPVCIPVLFSYPSIAMMVLLGLSCAWLLPPQRPHSFTAGLRDMLKDPCLTHSVSGSYKETTCEHIRSLQVHVVKPMYINS